MGGTPAETDRDVEKVASSISQNLLHPVTVPNPSPSPVSGSGRHLLRDVGAKDVGHGLILSKRRDGHSPQRLDQYPVADDGGVMEWVDCGEVDQVVKD
ncbi:MAG: hypothetical protein ACYCOR_10785 [Acidobacteriaceae bacterium]